MNDDIFRKLLDISMEELFYEFKTKSSKCKQPAQLQKGKEIIDNLSDFFREGVDQDVQLALILYAIYRFKGGMKDE